MNNSDEALNQPTPPDLNQILEAINSFKQEVNSRFDKIENEVNSRFDKIENEANSRFDNLENRFNDFQKNTEVQLEVIRQGLVENNVAFDRLLSNFHSLRANVTELTEEIRHKRKILA